MTATQAPTPGPLSGPYRAEFGAIHHEADAGFLFTVSPASAAEQVARALNVYSAYSQKDVAPTAPVEASGSDVEVDDDHLPFDMALDLLCTADDMAVYAGAGSANVAWVARHAKERLAALRPQPSGETREAAIEELIAGYAVMHEAICFMAGTSGADGRWYYEKASAAFEKVKPLHVFTEALSARPLALGGQQGVEIDEEDDDDDPHSPCSVCGDEHPDGVLEDGCCPSCCDEEED